MKLSAPTNNIRVNPELLVRLHEAVAKFLIAECAKGDAANAKHIASAVTFLNNNGIQAGVADDVTGIRDKLAALPFTVPSDYLEDDGPEAISM